MEFGNYSVFIAFVILCICGDNLGLKFDLLRFHACLTRTARQQSSLNETPAEEVDTTVNRHKLVIYIVIYNGWLIYSPNRLYRIVFQLTHTIIILITSEQLRCVRVPGVYLPVDSNDSDHNEDSVTVNKCYNKISPTQFVLKILPAL